METRVTSENELLARAQRHDRLALAEIYDRYSPGIFRYARRLLGDADLAEDCVADTFQRFLLALRRQRGPREHLQAYLFRIAHNWVTDHYRREAPVEGLEDELWPDTSQDPEADAQQHIQQGALRKAIRQLTPDQQQVILLKYVEDWDNAAIARAMHKPVGSIKSLQHRALARLQSYLEKE